jgi:hypothetical protein
MNNKAGRNVDSSVEEYNIKVDVRRTGGFMWLKLICRALSW